MLGDIKVLEVKKPVFCFVLNLIFVDNGIYHCAQLVLQETEQDQVCFGVAICLEQNIHFG